jgi:diguanylate cyclase (GGDEF)-like protein/PAS domain S-box-containing protein
MLTRSTLALTGAVAAVYVAAAKFGFTMAFSADQVTLVWPPTGLSLAALLFFGRRACPGIFLGAFIANVTTHEPLAVAAAIAAGNTLEAVVAAQLLNRFTGMTDSLERLRHALGLVGFGALLSTIVSATIGVTSLCAGGVQSWASFGSLWWTWWLGDATGSLLVTPLLMTWRAWPRLRRERRMLEAAITIVCMAAAAVGVFGGKLPAGAAHYPLEFVVFPFVIWAALRFGVLGASVANAVLAGIAIWGTLKGIGPYASGDAEERLMLLQVFMGMVSGTGLLLGAAVSESRAAARRQRAEHEITQALASAANAEVAMRRVLETVCTVLDWNIGLVWYVDRDANCLRCADFVARGPLECEEFERISRTRAIGPGTWLPGRVWEQRTPLWVPDLASEGRPSHPNAPPELRAAFAFPITVGSEALGVVEFFSRSVRRVDAELLQMLASVGAELGQYLARRRVEREILESEARKAGMLEAAFDCIVTVDHDGRIVEFNPAAERTFGYSRDQALGQHMADLIIPEGFRDDYRRGLARYLETGSSSIVGHRLEIMATRADGREFPAELSIAIVPSAGRPMFTGFLRDITSQKRLVNQLAYRATHDPLTKTLNRTAFIDRIHQIAKTDGGSDGVAILFVDLDRFKEINDSLGHMAGDELLVSAARRLRRCVRPGDAVARLGGDEFAVLIETRGDESRAGRVADRVMKALNDPFDVDGRQVNLTASVGIAFGSAGVSRAEDLLQSADAAMYRAKAAGRAQIRTNDKSA